MAVKAEVKPSQTSKMELSALSRWLFSQKAPSEIFDWVLNTPLRISHRRSYVKKGVPINFAKFTRKHLCQGLFFNEVGGLRPATLLKKRLWHRCFPANFAKFLRTPFFRTPPDDCFWPLPFANTWKKKVL